jgi:Ca2+-dependent lipid-binding protein
MQSRKGGKLVLHVEEATLKRDTETFGTMDPYCKTVFNGKDYKTATKTDAGKHPKWNYRMELEIEDLMDKITFNVYNKNTFSDD